MSEAVAQALARILTDQGRERLWRDPERARHSLLLRCPEASDEVEAVVAALEEGFPQRSEASSAGPDFLPAEQRRLCSKWGISPQLALEALNDWSRALHLVPPT